MAQVTDPGLASKAALSQGTRPGAAAAADPTRSAVPTTPTPAATPSNKGGVPSTRRSDTRRSSVEAQGQVRCQARVSGKSARAKGDGICGNIASKGVYCKFHSSLAATKKPSGRVAPLARYQKLGEKMHVSPTQAMVSLLQEAAGNVEYLRGKVTELERLVIAGKKEREEIAKTLVIYNEERDRLERYTTDALRINLEARQAQLSKMQSEALVAVVKAVVESLGLMGRQRAEALAVASNTIQKFVSVKRIEAGEWKGPLAEAGSEESAAERVFPDEIIGAA